MKALNWNHPRWGLGFLTHQKAGAELSPCMKYEWDAKKEIMTMVEYSKLQNGSDIRGVALPLVAAEPVNLTEEAAGLCRMAGGALR